MPPVHVCDAGACEDTAAAAYPRWMRAGGHPRAGARGTRRVLPAQVRPAPRPAPRPRACSHRSEAASAVTGAWLLSAMTGAWLVLGRAALLSEGEACEGLVVLVTGRARVCVKLEPERSEREGEGGEGGARRRTSDASAAVRGRDHGPHRLAQRPRRVWTVSKPHHFLSHTCCHLTTTPAHSLPPRGTSLHTPPPHARRVSQRLDPSPSL